jgi:hypothetical protein
LHLTLAETAGQNQVSKDRAILTTLENCVSVLAGAPKYPLFVTPLAADFVMQSGGPLASASMLTLARGWAVVGSGPDTIGAYATAGKRFDTIVLDRCWDDPALRATLTRSSSEHSLICQMKSCLSDGGRLLMIAGACRVKRIRGALLSAGFRAVETFAIVPNIVSGQHLVSTHPLAMRTFMLRAHGLPNTMPRNPLQWARWAAVYLGADRIGISWYLFDAQL